MSGEVFPFLLFVFDLFCIKCVAEGLQCCLSFHRARNTCGSHVTEMSVYLARSKAIGAMHEDPHSAPGILVIRNKTFCKSSVP